MTASEIHMVIKEKDYLTTKEAAIFTGLSVSYLQKLCQKSKLPHHRSESDRIYFVKQDLLNWMLHRRYMSIDEIESEASKRVLKN